ncbi:hypothetical protein BASA81_001650 [Batrachochytrium salamandrivorans]|nr:hypothetical protein BASA81_001650 [Batrachochytrium salamandrivorans]
MSRFALVLGLAATALAASPVDEEESAVVHFSNLADDVRACFGSDCFSTVFCFQGKSSLDVTWITTEVVGVVEFDRKIKPVSFACESEDDFSLKSLFHLHPSRPETRLLARQSAGPSLMSKVFDLFSTQQSGESQQQQQLSSKFEVKLSPFGSSCFQMKAAATEGGKGDGWVHLETRSVLDVNLVPVAALGLVLMATSKRLSTMPEFYYLSGASMGVAFAVSVLVLVILHVANGRESGAHSRSQFGLAALVQASVLFMRKSVVDFLGDYVEYVVVYVVVSFSISLALIHYLLRTPQGVVLNPGLCDILNVLLACMGACFLAYCTTRSARWQVGMVSMTCVYTILSASLFARPAKAPKAFSTPSRSRPGAFPNPKTPDQALEFIAQNHHKFVLQRFDPSQDDTQSEEDDQGEDSGEGEGDLHYD